MMITNPNCDAQGTSDCSGEDSEIRILPLDDDSNIFLCRNHYLKEIAYRMNRNTEKFSSIYWLDSTTLKHEHKPGWFDIPSWYSLDILQQDKQGEMK